MTALRPPISLSMRMRSEAATLSYHRGENNQHGAGTTTHFDQSTYEFGSSSSSGSGGGSGGGGGGRNGNDEQHMHQKSMGSSKSESLLMLPGVTRPQQHYSSSNKKTSNKHGGGKQAQTQPQPNNPFERLSGSFDFVASGGVFPDRTMMTLPTAVCVRCASHASMCMSCTEVLCQEALNFYRQTRARGAASLFANAITQTGITKFLKMAIFKMWRNGFLLRERMAKARRFAAEKRYKQALCKVPLRGWIAFTKLTINERKDKEIEDLLARVEALETTVKRTTMELQGTLSQVKMLRQQKEERSEIIAIERQAQGILASTTAPPLELEEEKQQTLEKEAKSDAVADTSASVVVVNMQADAPSSSSSSSSSSSDGDGDGDGGDGGEEIQQDAKD